MIIEEQISFSERFFAVIIILLFLIILLYAMALLVEKYLLCNEEKWNIACFQLIAKKYNFNDETTGYMLAIASSIPEFTTNLLASLDQNTSMFKFGMGAITGSGAYGKNNLNII